MVAVQQPDPRALIIRTRFLGGFLKNIIVIIPTLFLEPSLPLRSRMMLTHSAWPLESLLRIHC